MSDCGHQCFVIGGPWISEDPDCPAHGVEARREERAREDEVTRLKDGIKAFLAPYPLTGDPGSHGDSCGETGDGCDCGAEAARYVALKALIGQ